jgi:S-methylmethionine-dependent homocysteine/selenocysteine methylase
MFYKLRDVLSAGADIIETASYQATLEGFKEFSDLNGKDAEKIIKKSVELAKTAIAKFNDG